MRRRIHTRLLIAGLVALPWLATSALAATPTANLGYSVITGAGDVISITRLPIREASGLVIYKDVTITLSVSPTGVLSLAADALKQAMSMVVPNGNLRPGTYADTSNPAYGLELAGPAPVAGQGYSEWTLSAAASVNRDNGGPAVIYVGDVANSPIVARLKAAGIDSKEFYYGIIGTGAYGGNPWSANAIIGVEQLGTQLKVASFTNEGKDQSTPVTFYLLDKQ